jgi:very-long-chain (3R)-3-hydroxyacyl-CoA dehydratase
VSSRLWVLWGLINLAVAPTTTGSVKVLQLPSGASFQLDLLSLLTAWCITEVIRYGFFACKVGGRRWR